VVPGAARAPVDATDERPAAFARVMTQLGHRRGWLPAAYAPQLARQHPGATLSPNGSSSGLPAPERSPWAAPGSSRDDRFGRGWLEGSTGGRAMATIVARTPAVIPVTAVTPARREDGTRRRTPPRA